MTVPSLVRWHTGANNGSGNTVVTSQTTPGSGAAGAPEKGNLLVACVLMPHAVGNAASAPGWAAGGQAVELNFYLLQLLTKTADGAESAAMTFTLTPGANYAAAVLVLEFSGAAAAVTNFQATAFLTSVNPHTGPSYIPLVDDYVVWFDNSSYTTPAPSSNAGATPSTGWTMCQALRPSGTGPRLVASALPGYPAAVVPGTFWASACTGCAIRLSVPSAPAVATPRPAPERGPRVRW